MKLSKVDLNLSQYCTIVGEVMNNLIKQNQRERETGRTYLEWRDGEKERGAWVVAQNQLPGETESGRVTGEVLASGRGRLRRVRGGERATASVRREEEREQLGSRKSHRGRGGR